MALSPFAVIAICVSLSTFVYKFIIYPLLLSPLAKIPKAHYTSPFTSTWINQKRQSGREISSIFEAHEKCGPVVQLCPNEVSFASMDGLRQIYTAGFNRDETLLQYVSFGTPCLVTLLPFHQHSARRRILGPVYTKSYLQNSQNFQILASELVLKRLLPLLHSKAQSGEPVDVLQLFAGASMDFMSAYIFGLTHSTDFIRDSAYCAHYLDLFHKRLHNDDKNAHHELEEHTLSILRAVESGNPDQPIDPDTPPTNLVVYSQLASGLDKSDPKLSPKERELNLAAELLDHMDAGREAGGISLTYLAYELSRKPALQAKLQAELSSLSPSLTASGGKEAESLPTARSIEALPLLEGIVMETLRLRTPSPVPLMRMVPPKGAVIEGYHIPGGMKVSTTARCLHLNPEVFPDPTTFMPERWLGNEKDVKEMRKWWWPFGSGGKMCIGNHFALQGSYSLQ
jgi:cytochrome P450